MLNMHCQFGALSMDPRVREDDDARVSESRNRHFYSR
jgi:hypothetical protein